MPVATTASATASYRKVGLIGGTTWESTLEYYRLLNQRSNRVLGGLGTIELVLYSLNFARLRAAVDSGDDADAKRQWINAVEALQQSGVELIAICSNAGHLRVDALAQTLQVPIVHIVDATAHALREAKCATAGILGTRETMREGGYYAKRLADNHGIASRIPDEREQAEVHRIIFEEIVRGMLSATSKERVTAIANRLLREGCDSIVLACTELPLLVEPGQFSAPVLDTLSLHVDEILLRAALP
jgi:aspartate racemase